MKDNYLLLQAFADIAVVHVGMIQAAVAAIVGAFLNVHLIVADAVPNVSDGKVGWAIFNISS